MSNHASTQSSVPVIAAAGPSHGDRRIAVNAIAISAAASARSNPPQTVFQFAVSW
jgi:hypothetical protein